MDFQKLGLFVEVVRMRRFVAVSESRQVDPSVVSRAIASLEDELGVKLLYRTTRKIAPTEAGLQFFSRVEPLLEEFQRAKSLLIEKRDSPSGTIRVTASVSFGLLFMIPLLAKFQIKYPEVKVDLIITDSVLSLVEERIDVAVRFGHLENSSFIASKLAPVEQVACASPSYLKRLSTPQKPKDIGQHNCLSFLVPGYSDTWRFRNKKNSSEEVVAISSSLRISNAIGLKESAKLGMGIALLPRLLVGREIEKGNLVALFENYDITATEFGSSVWLLYPSKDFLPSKVKVFIEFLKQDFSKLKHFEA